MKAENLFTQIDQITTKATTEPQANVVDRNSEQVFTFSEIKNAYLRPNSKLEPNRIKFEDGFQD